MTTAQLAGFWQTQIDAQLSSGLSAPAFCRLQALSYHKFSYWRRKLALPPSTPADSSAGFASVLISAPVATDSGLTLTLPNGVVISGLQAANISLLSAIMRLL